MRILCLEDVHNGSKYHRIRLPYSKLGATFTTALNDMVLAHCDILVINYNSSTPFQVIDHYRNHYGFKLILDIDDSWVYPLDHPLYSILQEQSFNFKMLMMMADGITCSTFELFNMISRYTSVPIRVIENFVPHKNVDPDTQFQMGELEDLKSFMKRDLRVGLLGSESHFPDYYEIRKDLRQIMKLPKLEFKLCGFSRKSQVHSIFKGLESYYTFFTPKNTDEYMKLYDEVDVLLCPLANNNLNICKSSLKRFEAASKGKILVLDRLYANKQDSYNTLKTEYFVQLRGSDRKPEEDWLGTVQFLLKNKEEVWRQMQKMPIYYELNSNHFPDKIKSLKQFITKISESEPISIPDNCKLYTIKYDKSQEDMFEPYINTRSTLEEKTYLFEHNVMYDVVKNDSNYYGVFSHKFRSKTGFNKTIVSNILRYEYDPANAVDPKNVVVTFCRNLKNAYLQSSDYYHPGFYKLFKEVCEHIGFTCPGIRDDVPTIYSSFFVAHGSHYSRFLEYLSKAIEYMERPENKKRFFKDANYYGLSSDELRARTGLEYYPMITFIIERLMTVYCLHFKLVVKNYELFSTKNLNYD